MNQYREEPEGEWEIDPLKPDGTSAPLVKENTALRARVRELEGAVEAAETRGWAQALEAAALVLCSRCRKGEALQEGKYHGVYICKAGHIRALLPAPAPGRDTEGSGTTDGGTDAA